jgi:arabinofuranosyltransferase
MNPTAAPPSGISEPDTHRVSPTEPGDQPRPGRSLPRWWPLVVPVIVVLVGAWLYRWVDEDAFINFRIIDNLVAGHGLVFNVGERVEVDSDPLWLFTVTGLHVVLPFVAIEWLSVVVGLVCTGFGFLTGGRAVQQLGRRDGATTVFPLGLLMVSVVAGVWEFATSGLEISMVFLWLGLCMAALVRVEGRRSGAFWPAVLMGLGTLIRPELAVVSVVFLAALAVVAAAPGWSGTGGRWRRFGVPLLGAVALPLAYQLFRMAYYALVVANTGLAKTAGSAWPSQGFTYLWNFVAPYTLWLPFLLAAPIFGGRAVRWWRSGDRTGVLLLVTPVAAGLVDLAYVVYVGGDYMHARLLLPAFFAVCLPIVVTPDQLRTLLAVPVGGIVVWSVVCAGWLRFVPPIPTSLNPQSIYISNERNTWIDATGNPHPITASDYRHALSGSGGALLRRLADQVPAGRQRMLVITNPYAAIDPKAVVPAHSPLPFTLAVDVPAIGVIGYLAGPKVYLFDTFSLANPIGSHTQVVVHARPGHEKEIGPSWMVARFGGTATPNGPSAGSTGATSAGALSASAVSAASGALTCPPLSSYLAAITAPLTVSRALSDVANSFSYTAMSFSADPAVAQRQLCGSRRPAS